MYTPIKDYAIIGNLRSAVLVSKNGSIDWAPAPFIDSESVFASILDTKKGGSWSITPTDGYSVSQQYIPETNVLQTIFTTLEGELLLTDFIPIESERTYLPKEEDTTFRIRRKVECTRGTCNVQVDFDPRLNYGRGETALSFVERGIRCQNEKRHGILITNRQFSFNEGGAHSRFTLSEEETEFFSFRYNVGSVDIEKDSNNHNELELQSTIKYWKDWSKQCDLEVCKVLPQRWQDEIVRSSLVLKILFFEPVGTVAAAATTSLPEWIGGVRNWDYRFTWLRDSAFTFKALFSLGHTYEADEYLDFLVRTCRLAAEDEGIEHLQIMYGLQGEEQLTEEHLDHFEGYRGSAPVRIGNGAYDQRQWDIYGSILDMVWYLHILRGDAVNEKNWPLLRQLANHVVKIWREPDEGLWEVRGGADHFTYSKVMCWVALDRAIHLANAYEMQAPINVWRAEREMIHREVMERGYNKTLGAFTQQLDGKELDASVLLFPAVGFVAGDDPRMRSTIKAIEEKLLHSECLVKRYDTADGLPGEEGAFLIASFWLVDAYVLAGEKEKAERMFQQLIQHKNHVGLYSEEIDPKTNEFLGNFPQAYTHIGLINSALLLADSDVKYLPE